MARTDRDDVVAWVAGQLAWERRLRELEAAAEPTEETVIEPATEPAARPAPGRGRGGLVGLAHPLTR